MKSPEVMAETIPLFFEGVESPVTVKVGAIVSSRLKWD